LSRLVAMDWRVRTWLPAYIGWIISTEKKPCPCFKISDMDAQKGLYHKIQPNPMVSLSFVFASTFYRP
jgi:hypothetical protein